MTNFQVVAASEFDIETLARLYGRTFERQDYTPIITPEQLTSFIYVEDLKLELSPVLRVGDDLAALTTVGLRGEHAYCRGFGVVPEHRGNGLANALCEQMIANAWRAGASDMVLGVLQDNYGAVKTYMRGGFQPLRELYSVEWVRGESPGTEPSERVREIAPTEALKYFDVFHTVSSIWNRDLPSLHKIARRQGLALWEGEAPRAYVLYRVDGETVEILDLAGTQVADGIALLEALQRTSARIVCYSEPEPRPMHEAFREAGFKVTHKRWEMRVARNAGSNNGKISG